MSDAGDVFARGLEGRLGPEGAGLIPLLRAHYELVVRFAARMALTADVDPESAIGHVEEGFWAADRYRATSVLDVGAGAGYPSIVVALARPELRITLLERNRRRAGFLEYVAAELGLAQLVVRCASLRELRSDGEGFATVAVRALPGLAAQAGDLWRLVGNDGCALLYATQESVGKLQGLVPESWSQRVVVRPGSRQRLLLVADKDLRRSRG